MTRRKIVLGDKPHTRIEIRSRRGSKPAWSRTILFGDGVSPTLTADFVRSAKGGDVASIDAFMDTLVTP